MRLGFIGTGVITSAMVTGFCKADLTALHILVSPRNAEKAAALATAFPSVEVARDNQDVVDRCDLVVLAVISQVARETIGTLQFRADQRVISLMALFSLSEVEDLVAPATRVCRAVPLPPVARGKCPIVQCPPDSEVRDLLSRIGTVIEVPDETQLNDLTAVTSLMAPFYAWLAQTQTWLEARGVDGEISSRYVSSLFHGLSLDVADVGAEGFEASVVNAQTPGGLNEEALGRLRKVGWFDEIDRVLDAILARLERGPTQDLQSGPGP